MSRLFFLIIIFNLVFCQSILDRLIVPIYIESEFSIGYDDNYLKLSNPDQDDNMRYRLGDSDSKESLVSKNRINILYIPYIFRNHETKLDFTINSSEYFESKLKSYNNFQFKLSQHLASYTWLKFQYSYTPSFYIKSYSQSDPHLYNSFVDNKFMPATFSSEKVRLELSIPIPYLHKMYATFRYLFESQYHNPDFTEFDLEIISYYFKIRKKMFKYFNISIAYMSSEANNISFMNGLLSTVDKDRGYVQEKIYSSVSFSKFQFFGRKISAGIYSSIESRDFSSKLDVDKLHFSRTHNDISITYWIKRHFNNNVDLKFKATKRERNTSSPMELYPNTSQSMMVSELKTFEKLEIWLSLILKMDLNVYK